MSGKEYKKALATLSTGDILAFDAGKEADKKIVRVKQIGRRDHHPRQS